MWSLTLIEWSEQSSNQRITLNVKKYEPHTYQGVLRCFLSSIWSKLIALPLVSSNLLEWDTMNNSLCPILSIWWYAPDDTPDTGISGALQGTAYIPFDKLQTYNIKETFEVRLYDLSGQWISTLKMKLLTKPSMLLSFTNYMELYHTLGLL